MVKYMLPVIKWIKENHSFEPLLALDKSKVSSCGGMDEGDDVTTKSTSFFFSLGNRKGNTSTKTWNFI
jgi:hypothetical protein